MKFTFGCSIRTIAASLLLMGGAAIAATPAVSELADPSATGPAESYGTGSVEEALNRYNFRRLYDVGPYARPADEFGRQAPLDWPAAEMREVAFARARTIIAKYEEHRVRSLLSEHVENLKEDFERSADFVTASQGQSEAWSSYQSAVASVMGRLAEDEEYRALEQLAIDLGVRIEDVKLDEGDPIERIGWRRGSFVSPVVIDLASNKLGYARRATEIRAAALAADPAVAEARARLHTAGERVRQLRAEFDTSIRRDETSFRLRDALAEARTAHVAAATYEDSARIIRRFALRYAIYLHRNDSSPYYGNVYGGSYGGGYGSVGSYDAAVVPISGSYGFRRR